jgi:1-acyl-sn-glycerol-3-phosphate acyltransferase
MYNSANKYLQKTFSKPTNICNSFIQCFQIFKFIMFKFIHIFFIRILIFQSLKKEMEISNIPTCIQKLYGFQHKMLRC